ncbi:unnamed protein product, partial [marine sediment metagenome]
IKAQKGYFKAFIHRRHGQVGRAYDDRFCYSGFLKEKNLGV